MLASLACANSMCKMALPTSVYATYTRAVSPLRMKDAAGTPEVPAPVLHMGRLRQPPKRQSHHTNSNHQHNNHDILPCRDCDPEHGLGLHPTHTFHGSALAGAQLSGVLAEGVSLLSVGERGRAPCRRHLCPPKNVLFYGVLCSSHVFPFFGSCGLRWVNMGQHSPQDGPT